jgi:hypothetical protein
MSSRQPRPLPVQTPASINLPIPWLHIPGRAAAGLCRPLGERALADAEILRIFAIVTTEPSIIGVLLFTN